MHHFFVSPANISSEEIIIDGPDVNHIKNVLRKKIGDEIAVSNGEDGREYRCRIERMDDVIGCRLEFVKEADTELPVKIYLFQGLAKGDKMETVVQKAVELGAFEIIPVAMKRSVVKYDEKKARSKTERLRLVSEAAAKQSRRCVIPNVHDVLNVHEAIEYASRLDRLVVPYELEGVDINSDKGTDAGYARAFGMTRDIMESLKGVSSVGIFIGPEGGFDEEEIAALKSAGADIITLGKRILRTETAGMAVISWLIYITEICGK
jgi:16S rRNA (uracil1498-N3)-methyltransferase